MKFLFRLALITASSFFLNCIFLAEDSQSAACVDNTSSTYTSWFDYLEGKEGVELDPNSWLNQTNGSCNGTPEVYGVRIFRMGVCSVDPFQGIPMSPSTAGNSPDFSNCFWTFSNGSAEYVSFTAGTSAELSQQTSQAPPYGSYQYLILDMQPLITIQDSLGPIDGTTYYSTIKKSIIGNSIGSTDQRDHDQIDITLKSFTTEMCDPSSQGIISGKGTISGWLLNQSFQTLADAGTGNNDTTVEDCGDSANRLIVVTDLENGGPGVISITSATTGLEAIFDVSDNGSNIYYVEGDQIHFGLGPFSVYLNPIEN